MKTMTFTTERLAEELVENVALQLKGFISLDERAANCNAWRTLFGEDFFREACDIAKRTKILHADGTCTFFSVDDMKYVNRKLN